MKTPQQTIFALLLFVLTWGKEFSSRKIPGRHYINMSILLKSTNRRYYHRWLCNHRSEGERKCGKGLAYTRYVLQLSLGLDYPIGLHDWLIQAWHGCYITHFALQSLVRLIFA